MKKKVILSLVLGLIVGLSPNVKGITNLCANEQEPRIFSPALPNTTIINSQLAYNEQEPRIFIINPTQFTI